MAGGREGMTLREMLGVAKDPDFELKLLPGWERHVPDDADFSTLDSALRDRFMQMNRPDLHAATRAQLRQAFDSMQKNRVIAYYAATADVDNAFYIPGSIVVSERSSQTGGPMDDVVTHAIREFGAAPLFGDKRFIRFERESSKEVDGGTMLINTITYMTPIPGSKRRRSLQFVASFGRPGDMPADDGKVLGWKAAFDICISTLRWVPASQ